MNLISVITQFISLTDYVGIKTDVSADILISERKGISSRKKLFLLSTPGMRENHFTATKWK